MPSVIVHHLESSRSTRVLWLLEELGVPYELREYKRDPKTWRAGEDLRRVHPLGKSPVVEVDGKKLVESGAILETLLDVFGDGRLRPASGTEELVRYRMFLHFAEGSMMTPLFVSLLMARIRGSKVPFFIKPITRKIAEQVNESYARPEMASQLAFLESELASRPFVAGPELTAADIQMSYPLEAAVARAGLDGRYPNLMAYLERTRARDAYKRAVTRGGPMVPARE
jgi:glutathione S-transferase